MSMTTRTAPRGWAPDVIAFPPEEVVPDALVLTCTTVMARIEGDAPLLRVPWIDDDPADVYAEDEEIAESDPVRAETLVATVKVAQLVHSSREQLAQPAAAERFAESSARAVTAKMNTLFLNAPAPTIPTGATGDDRFRNLGPTGITHATGITKGGEITNDLDALHDAVATIEGDGGTATHIIAGPAAWASLSKLKTATGAATNLLGAGVQAGPRMILSTPVLVTSAAPPGTLIVIDSTTIVSAVGELEVAQSEHSSFRRDAVDVRVTFRAGWAAMRPQRIVRVTIT